MNGTFKKLIKIGVNKFSEKGYYGTSMQEISDELGIRKPSLYNYIDSKEDLFIKCLEICEVENINIIQSINVESLSIQDSLISFFEKYMLDNYYLIKFHIQLSFVPNNIVYRVEEYNENLMNILNNQLKILYKNQRIKVEEIEFLSIIKPFMAGEIFGKIIMVHKNNLQINKKNFIYNINLLLDNLLI
ncbi:TetR/AcrR family transcriptional regulator [Mammaliicoccus sciuri]|uniref:TetR/AcrR family transcriptional regulator n=1 Tax=Mammaliicoccus sciuri TaxID=1296 RepID=UPI001C4F2FB0|nr:TetR/AcrR family transcriptional regulator [Mammaliicoccus sciuri]MCD3220668.1 TetR/AcrR family transcriptional regulator [Mammaliicoccus sciuri]